MKYQKLFFPLTIGIPLISLFLIAINFSPFLRGPGPYPPQWRWPYLFSNTLTRIWFPGIMTLVIVSAATQLEKRKKLITHHPLLSLSLVILMGYIFQLSILYYSRAGILVLIHRTINPLISGYFATAVSIHSLPIFFKTFDSQVGNYPMYARFHPPLADLFFSPLLFLSQFLSPLFSFITNHTPSHADVAKYWLSFTASQRTAVLLASFGIPLLAELAVIPIFWLVKQITDQLTAFRASLLFILIPSIILFSPLNDVLMPLITATSLYLFYLGFEKRNRLAIFLSGLILFTGVLSTLTFLSVFPFFFFLFLFRYFNRLKPYEHSKAILFFVLGLLILPVALLLFFHYNFLHSLLTLLTYHEAVEIHRSYLKGLFYAPYDFLLFLGLPISIYLLGGIPILFKKGWNNKKTIAGALTLSLWLMVLLSTLSGSVRVESARIWTPYIPLALVVAVLEMKRRKITTNQVAILLLLMVIQVIVFQTVLVTVW